MATRPSVPAGKSLGQRSLAGCSPWGHKEVDTTARPNDADAQLTGNCPPHQFRHVILLRREVYADGSHCL